MLRQCPECTIYADSLVAVEDSQGNTVRVCLECAGLFTPEDIEESEEGHDK